MAGTARKQGRRLTLRVPREMVQLSGFYPRDAMLARVLATALCLSVCLCLSQVGVLPKRLNESRWVLTRELLSCVKRKFWYLKNMGTFLWNFLLNSGRGARIPLRRKGIFIGQLPAHCEL